MTRAPITLPSSTAARPTPPEAPSTASVSPGEPGAILQRVVGRAVGDEQSGGPVEIEVVRYPDEPVGGDRDPLAGGAPAGVAHHPIAGLDVGHARSDAFDGACEFGTGRERKGWLVLILAGDDQVVEEVQRGSCDRDHRFAGARHRVGDVGHDEVVGACRDGCKGLLSWIDFPASKKKMCCGRCASVVQSFGQTRCDLSAFTLPSLPIISLYFRWT